jgi:hypothetical protein
MTNTLLRMPQATMFLEIQVKLNERDRIVVLCVHFVITFILIPV